IVYPPKLPADEQIAICAECHAGFGGQLPDPLPGDLLVANQAIALKNSECFIQSAKALTCTTCHDPHRDSSRDRAAIKACLRCHSKAAKPHAGICPVNSVDKCIACHMPSIEMGPLQVVDHWIRVHPEQNVQVPTHNQDWYSQIKPQREFL